MTKGVGEKINEGVPRRFGPMERMENDRIAKTSMWESLLVFAQWVGCRNSWIDTVKD